MPLSTAQSIECFHLGFLAVLRTRLDVGRYVLKGGANLRFFFASVRYSEDIDLDVRGVAGWKLEEQVDKVLASDALRIALRAAGVAVLTDQVSKPKQTETTRRWKIGLATDGRRDPVRTKVEVSARNGESRVALEPIPTDIVRPYAMRPPSVMHYLIAPATEQKVRALAGRPETQARDVFALDHLLARTALEQEAVPPAQRAAAAEAALALPYEAFQDQVLPFLEPAIAEVYDRDAWSQMQERVIRELLA